MNKNNMFKTKKTSGCAPVILFFILIAILAVIGWVMNIVKLAGMDLDPITSWAVLRVVGIFVAPMGSVLGFL